MICDILFHTQFHVFHGDCDNMALIHLSGLLNKYKTNACQQKRTDHTKHLTLAYKTGDAILPATEYYERNKEITCM